MLGWQHVPMSVQTSPPVQVMHVIFPPHVSLTERHEGLGTLAHESFVQHACALVHTSSEPGHAPQWSVPPQPSEMSLHCPAAHFFGTQQLFDPVHT